MHTRNPTTIPEKNNFTFTSLISFLCLFASILSLQPFASNDAYSLVMFALQLENEY